MSLDSAIVNQTITKKKQGLISKNKKCFDSADYFGNASNYARNQQIVAPTQNSPNYADDEEIVSVAPTQNADSQQDQLSLEDLIHLSMKLKQKTVQSNSFVEQTFPMLVSLFAKDVKSTARLPVDLICVIDNSGSMQGEKIELVKSTLNLLLRYLGDMDRLSIVTFNSNAFRLNPLLRANEANKERIVRDIKGIYAGGGTDINLGMRQAFEILEKRRYKNPVTSVFLLSDGQDMGAQSKVQASLAQYISLKSLTVNTFGFGNDHDSQLMSDIAGLRDGNFYFIKELDEVDKTFVDCLGGLLSSVAQRVEIKIKPEQSEVLQGIEIIKAYGDNSMWKHENQVYTTSFLNLISGSQKDFVLEVKIPTNAKDIQDHERSVKIASVEAEIVDFENQHCIKKADLYITLENEGEESKEEEVEEADREVMKNFFRLRSAALMNEARNLADQNKNEEANKVLQNFKEELENSFMKDEQFIKNLIQDIEKAKTYVKPQMYKKVGKHGLLSNSRAHTYQKTTFDSANYFCFQNKKQTEMLEDLATMKNQ